ncbi:MAG: hypothetical protein IPL08_06930 [Saprospiraceae bacterium]|nr:hypothetical protein [Saprospiraceae bacterium]
MLDTYVKTGVSQIIGLEGQNNYICKQIDEKGIPHYEDEAVKMGFDSSGYGTQSAFLIMIWMATRTCLQLNHSTYKNNTFYQRKSFENTVNRLSGDRMYRNDKGNFH